MEYVVTAWTSDTDRRTWTPRRWTRLYRGQSIVELALALPVLLLLLFGTIDLGRSLFEYVQMRNAVFEGARYAARNPADSSGITARVTQHGVPAGTTVLAPTCSTGSCSTITVDDEATITVKARKTFTPITLSFLQSFFGIGQFTMEATATTKVMT